MELKSIFPQFIDMPEPAELVWIIDRWKRPDLPGVLQHPGWNTGRTGFPDLSGYFREKLSCMQGVRLRKQFEKLLIGWLYGFVRLNLKRGRFFDLREVLGAGQADCLGYAKIFTVLGRLCGLDMGVVEIIIDNRGRVVPHTATLVKLADGSCQFIDFWYGSLDIRHRRLGLSVKQDEQWRIEDLDFNGLNSAGEISYLPDYCVDAITLYIEGNRSLKNRDYNGAVKHYSQAISLYPQNARLFYNRAVAYENLGELEKARADYARALRDNSSILRTLAAQPEDIVGLIKLDESNIPEPVQYIYLLHRGFITGRRVSTEKIARKTGLDARQVSAILDELGAG